VLQVSVAEGNGFAEGFTMQKCWVSLLSSRFPVLAVAIDDALLACADRLIEHWRKPGVLSLTSPCCCIFVCPVLCTLPPALSLQDTHSTGSS